MWEVLSDEEKDCWTMIWFYKTRETLEEIVCLDCKEEEYTVWYYGTDLVDLKVFKEKTIESALFLSSIKLFENNLCDDQKDCFYSGYNKYKEVLGVENN